MRELADILERLRHVERQVGDIRVDLGKKPDTTHLYATVGTGALLLVGALWTLAQFMGPPMMREAVRDALHVDQGAAAAAASPAAQR